MEAALGAGAAAAGLGAATGALMGATTGRSTRASAMKRLSVELARDASAADDKRRADHAMRWRGVLHPKFKGPIKAALEVEAVRLAVHEVVTRAIATAPWCRDRLHETMG